MRSYLTIAIVCIIASLLINYFFDQLDIVPRREKVFDLNGLEKDYTVLIYSHKYVLMKILAEFLFTLSIAIIIFFLIENKLKDLENRLQQKDRDENEKKLQALQEKINTDVFEGVLKKVIPPSLFDVLARDILNRDVIRQHTKWDYEIEETDKGWKLEQYISYELYNITNVIRTVPLEFDIQYTEINKGEFSNYKFLKNDGAEFDVKPSFQSDKKTIYNLDIHPKQTVKVKYKIVNEYSTKYVVDVHFTNYSIIGLDINVRKPSNCSFIPVPTFTQKLNIAEERPQEIQYETIKGVLIGQALAFMIEPKREDQVNQPAQNEVIVSST